MLRLAYRLAHYQGAVRNAYIAAKKPNQAATRSSPAAPAEDVRWIPSTPAALAASPLARYISTTTIGGDPSV